MSELTYTTVKEQGFEGILYPGDGSRDKVLIVVSGSNGDKDVKEEHIIPVENIKAPVLILSAVNDMVWPSYDSGKCIEKR